MGRRRPLRLVDTRCNSGYREGTPDRLHRHIPTPAGPSARAPGPPAAPRADARGLAVLDPGTGVTQQEALWKLGLAGDEFAERIFSRSGVERRQLNLDDDFLTAGLEQRTAGVEQELLDQAVEALERLDVGLEHVGTVLTSSLYSLGCPSLAHRLIERCGLDPATDKYHVTSVGCASAVPAVPPRRADPARRPFTRGAGGRGREHELAAGARRRGEPRASRRVGAAIFGDGCAAALLSERGEASGPAILATAVHQVPGTLGAVEITADEQGSYLGLRARAAAHRRRAARRSRRGVPRRQQRPRGADRPLDAPSRRTTASSKKPATRSSSTTRMSP